MLELSRRTFVASAAAWLGASSLSVAHADNWPSKPIRLVVPAPPGGISDGVARLIAQALQTDLKQTVIVDNKPGGSAVIAERTVMNAPADGHTLLVGPSSVWTDFPLTVKTPFDVQKTFTYVADVASMVHVLVATPSFPVSKAQDVVGYAQRSKSPISIANLSPGTRSDMLGSLLSEKSGGKITIVPYKGSAPAIADVMGNQVQLTFEVATNVASLVASGKVKALGVVSAQRSRVLPQVPSFAELGMSEFVLPDASAGLFVLSSQPPAVTQRIRQAMEAIMRSPQFQEKLKAQGFDAPQASSQAQLQQKLLATVAQNREILAKIKTAGG